MNEENLVAFYERAGFRVARTTGVNWYVPGGRVFRAIPVGRPVSPVPEELASVCRQHGILGAEFANLGGSGIPGGQFVLRDQAYGPRTLQRQFRQWVGRALSDQVVREIDFQELQRLGRAANQETLARQGRVDPHYTDPELWRQLCEAGQQVPGAGVFAAFAPDGLAAYLVYFLVKDTCYGLFSKSRDRARLLGTNHALYFTYAEAMIRRPGVVAVTAGPQGLPPIASLDRFKSHAGFQLEACPWAVTLRPAVRALILSPLAAAGLWAGESLLGHDACLERLRLIRAAASSSPRLSPRSTAA